MPLVFGVPMMPLLVMFIIVASIAVVFGLIYWLLALPIWFIMAQVTKNDDKAFRIWWLWIDTKWRNYSSFWQASTYTTVKRDRLWE